MPLLRLALPLTAVLLLSACGGRDAFTSTEGMDAHQLELQKAFAICAGCHNVDPALGNRVGPNLYGVIGRQAGSQPGYSYSTALGAADFAWDEARLDQFLRNPPAMFPGTRMVNATADPARRAAVIEYLKAHASAAP
jgi:cytochrome c